ncbi:BTAD domain-containing putative transcriptional regulator [Actinoplanes sp. NPDC049548]|uniref:BTAD domain-containing putative transcriptional regulator n=1 Tax=Actinoplanes sp. NPDC049548 TaxID=3155152 RepID=UPI0034274874
MDTGESLRQVRVNVLGSVTVSCGDATVAVEPAMVRNLLAVLALNAGRSLPWKEIVGALWGDDSPSTARALVHTYVSRLRAQLRNGSGLDNAVVWDGTGYRLSVPPDSIDLGRFDQLCADARRAESADDVDTALSRYREAFACWRGEIAADLNARIRDLPAATAARQRWVDAVTRYANLCDRTGQATAALDLLRRAAASAPLHEGVHASLMGALTGAGERAAALQTYAGIRERLAEEFGVDPGAELQSLYLGILREDSLEPTVPPPRARRRRPATAILVAVLAVAVVAVGAAAWTGRGGRSAGAAPSPEPAAQADDFTGSALNSGAWGLYERSFPNGSVWSPSMVRVGGGELQILGVGTDPTGAGNMSGGTCWCEHGEIHRYGRWEVRAKFDAGSGYAPEIGLWPDDSDETVDGSVVARFDEPSRASFVPTVVGRQHTQLVGSAVTGEFTSWATYAIEVRPDFVAISVDGRTVLDTRQAQSPLRLPSAPMFLYIQQRAGPSGSAPAANSRTPNQVVAHIDWVKWYP